MEVIVTTAAEALAAQQYGASRVELVAHPERGGLSPQLGVVRAVLGAVRIPVHAMLRPHDRGFVYDAADRRLMRRCAAGLAQAGVQGIVFGALDSAGTIDTECLSEIVDAAAGVQMTFHRAFDLCAHPIDAFERLAKFPLVTRVLSAGCAPDAWSGRELLRELVTRTTPAVLAGGGINAENAAALTAFTGVREIHVGSGARTAGSIDPQKIARLARIVRAGRPVSP